jgi:hypothetical protein
MMIRALLEAPDESGQAFELCNFGGNFELCNFGGNSSSRRLLLIIILCPRIGVLLHLLIDIALVRREPASHVMAVINIVFHTTHHQR